ncbi:[protein-PII] uridylyltransferase [Chitinivorax tropicus]|uniref:Bifunctional uridylyltransferase/uridylyl-removing enzyme n=1 Tax=Chitinivorax tropicus TaxID=714531 RepID=A0A840MMC7_9PROT|nr:[protein-PII] uridylyltransferase [Chitinivorax tropicus]MBB5019570.1 [protein-PII] uridylyltransferase [Chitinivorax tropicus]
MNTPPAIPVIDAAHWRTHLQRTRDRLRAHYLASQDVEWLLRAHSQAIDEVLARLWTDLSFTPDVGLIAVGGYGRQEIYPFSDIDLLILIPHRDDVGLNQRIEYLISLFWDIGLDVGHSVRTLEECVQEADKDLTVQTTLLEARPLACEPMLFQRLKQALHAQLDPLKFYEAKLLEQQQRHMRFHGVAYNLEPNTKESPGGLRDLQVIIWIATGANVGRTWSDLASKGIISTAEARQIHRAEKVLKNLRVGLHYLANRREDRLLFDLQNQLAQAAAFSDSATQRASERLMQSYYRAARTVLQLNDILVQNLKGRIVSILAPVEVLNERFFARNNLLLARDLKLFEKQPAAIFEAFLLFQQHASLAGLGAKTLRALWNARGKINADFRANPRHQQLFMDILRAPRGQTRVLRRMNLYGILGRYIPAFGKIVGLMQHDLFHVYTVDEHILMVVRNLRRFAVPEFAHEYPLCSKLIADFDKPELLYLAGLFHDIAKGRGGDHSSLGKVDALEFADQHGLSPQDSELVAWLVGQHLNMSSVAQKQDVYDPEVIDHFATEVGTQRRLTALYLLTVADIRGTSPKVWNNWKAKLLEDLFHATSRRLSAGNFNLVTYIEERQHEAQALLRYYGLTSDAHKALWKELDTVYFMRHDAREIAWHTRALYWRTQDPTPVVKAKLSDDGDGLQVLVYVPDQPQLFARLCNYFERARFSIGEAKIYTTRHGFALDSFYVFIPENSTDHYRDLIALIEYELTEKLRMQAPIEMLSAGRISRQLKHFPLQPQISIRSDDKQNYYVMSVIAGDRPGLLSRITHVLNNWQISIHSAKISTLGERAEDTFLITGPGLSDSKILVQVEADLLGALST